MDACLASVPLAWGMMSLLPARVKILDDGAARVSYLTNECLLISLSGGRRIHRTKP